MTLLRCTGCAFEFKWPPIPEDKLLACYGAAAPDHWGGEVDARERNFDRIAQALARNAKGRRILDVGCFNGAFLDYLGPSWDRFGVEPNGRAAEIARSRGVRVMGETIEQIAEDAPYDVVTALDVVEHIVDPLPFFVRVARLLKPEGIMVLTTGNTESWTWRLQQNRYWYCSYIPEHVSFYQRRTMVALAARSGLRSIDQIAMSHKRAPFREQATQSLKGIAFAVGLRLGWLGVPALRRRFVRRAGTNWIAARDHMIHVMRKNGVGQLTVSQ
jgi:SAM-dependent methyltransferase